jgi:hypothetical protein
MTQPLKITGNTASLTKEVVVGNATYRVTVTVEPIQEGRSIQPTPRSR